MKTKNGFCQKLEFFMKDLGFSHIWENQNTFSKRQLVKSVGNKLQERYVRYWKIIFDEDSGVYCSKLRTYKDLKCTYNLERYLLLDIDKLHVKNYLKVRIYNSRLMIEQGRHKQLEVNKRVCPICLSEIETEFHFIMKCPSFNDQREKLFHNIYTIVPSFKDMSETDKFVFIMQSNDYDISKICVTSIGNMYNDRIGELCVK